MRHSMRPSRLVQLALSAAFSAALSIGLTAASVAPAQQTAQQPAAQQSTQESTQQPAGEPTLDKVLARIAANTAQYNASIPSFLADESITSQEIHDGKLKHETRLQATFRITRSANGTLSESREWKSVDGKPATGQSVKMPIFFSGGFSGALTKFLSADHRRCFDFHLQPGPGVSTENAPLTLTFNTPAVATQDPLCASIIPGTTGTAILDPVGMQVMHIERTAPQPVGRDRTLIGLAAVDFAPTPLNGQTFWLPTAITATTSETPTTHAFRFTALYSNFHRFAATSTLLPVAPSP